MQKKILFLLQAAALPLVLAQDAEEPQTTATTAALPDETTAPDTPGEDAPAEDAPGCETIDYSAMFEVPRPTGALLEAISSYASEILEPSDLTASAGPTDGDEWLPTLTAWCAFPTEAPEDVQPALTEYLSELGVWGTSMSSAFESASAACPSGIGQGLVDADIAYDFVDAGVLNVYTCVEEATATDGGEGGDGPQETGGADADQDGDDGEGAGGDDQQGEGNKEDEDKDGGAGMAAAFGLWTVVTGAVAAYML